MRIGKRQLSGKKTGVEKKPVNAFWWWAAIVGAVLMVVGGIFLYFKNSRPGKNGLQCEPPAIIRQSEIQFDKVLTISIL